MFRQTMMPPRNRLDDRLLIEIVDAAATAAAQPDRRSALRRRIVVVKPAQRLKDRGQRHRLPGARYQPQPGLRLHRVGIGCP
jgi:hypothetical protein